MIRLFTVIAIATVLSAPAVNAQEGKKCPTVHEGPVAVFIEPTKEELEALKEERGADDFSTIADDVMWYDYQAMKYLKERDIPFCFTTEERHVFVSEDGKRYTEDKECDAWCLLLWNGTDEPVYTDSIDIDMHEEYLMGG